MEEEYTGKTETRFNSPIPMLMKLRDTIFGKLRPDLYTRITAYISLLIWIIFLSWHIISYFAISFRDVIRTEKKVDVEALIYNRAAQLGFNPETFLQQLLNYHLISAICWGVVFIGIVFLWRKMRVFALFLLGGVAVYYGLLLFYMGFRYFNEDTTLFDKILLAVLTGIALLYFLLLKSKKKMPVEDIGSDEII